MKTIGLALVGLVLLATTPAAQWLDVTPEGAALFKKNLAGKGKDDPGATCHPMGVPSLDTLPIPYKIVQTPGLIAILYEGDTGTRTATLCASSNGSIARISATWT